MQTVYLLLELLFQLLMLPFYWIARFSRRRKAWEPRLDRKTFRPNPDFKSEFPWEDIMRCSRDRLPGENFRNHKSCPQCGRPSDKLAWIKFTSPGWTWRENLGSLGPLSVCPDCGIQVEYRMKWMN